MLLMLLAPSSPEDERCVRTPEVDLGAVPSEEGNLDTRSARLLPDVPPFDADRDANPPLPSPADLNPSLRLAKVLLGLLAIRELLAFVSLFFGPPAPATSSSSSRENELRFASLDSEPGCSRAAEGGWKPLPPELAERQAGPRRG